MKLLTICILGLAILAAPCLYDPKSQEPSPLVGLVAAASHSAASLLVE
ncbi:hypothetical protein V1283_006498 [Bradyrhizobium sp. AZCC 2262]